MNESENSEELTIEDIIIKMMLQELEAHDL